MITKITGEQAFQVLTNNFSISPSNEGYTLQISADGKSFSNLFTVGAGVTRLVTGVAANSYYRLSGNASEVVINWMKTCVTEGGGSGSGTTYTAGEYISIQNDTISVTGITPDLYLTSADTQDFVTSGDVKNQVEAYHYLTSADTQDFATEAYVTGVTSPIQTQVDDIERVTATALTELHDAILELSGDTGDFATHAEVTAATADLASQSYVDSHITAATQDLATTGYVQSAITAATEGFLTTADTEAFLTTADTQDFLTTADTGEFLTSADTINFMDSGDSVVISTALNDLNDRLSDIEGDYVHSDDVTRIVHISQADYDDLVLDDAVDPNTLYIITSSI